MIDADKLQIAIDFIESSLDKDIALDNVANRVGISKFHFHRIFKDVLGVTVSEYIRNRRLSIAAEQLVAGKLRVIDVACEAGFTSQSAFTHSFKKLFGVTPTGLIENNVAVTLYRRASLEAYRYAHKIHEMKLDVRIVEMPEIKLVGMEHSASTKDMQNYSDDAYLVHSFLAQCHKIKSVLAGPSSLYTFATFRYGIEEATSFCGLQVAEFDGIPDGMVAKILPSGDYAMFIHRGIILRQIHKTTDCFYLSWLPKSEYDLNYQGNDKKIVIYRSTEKTTNMENSEIDMFVPVIKKSVPGTQR
jgi:AraC family transcriptional regulator